MEHVNSEYEIVWELPSESAAKSSRQVASSLICVTVLTRSRFYNYSSISTDNEEEEEEEGDEYSLV
jgi:hypothetical protein